jgi:hypothetical protein
MSESPQKPSQQPAQEGPSWLLMLALIFLAMLAALAIAWAFISPLLHR